MYVVVEFNQASHRPSMASDDVYDTVGEAEEVRDEFAARTAEVGRRERYEVFALEEIET